MTAISIVMPCHNRNFDLRRVLAAYDGQSTALPFELIAVDDASTDSTYALLSSYQPRHYSLRPFRFDRNQGPAAARNRGIGMARSPLILFVGDDILPKSDFVQAHLDAHRKFSQPKVAILGRVQWAADLPQNTLMMHVDGIGAQQFSYHYMSEGTEYDFRHLYTSNVSLKTDFLFSLDHWFDCDFPHAAFEDAELGYRLAQRGLRIIYTPQPVGEHYHYHTIWSFSRRQYECGQMAWVLARKHPLAADKILRGQFAHLISSVTRFNHALSKDEVDNLEAKALYLASFYEWQQHPDLQTLYLKLLEYFYFKGFVQGMFADSIAARRINGGYASLSLLPLVRWFVAVAKQTYTPLPVGYRRWDA